MRVPSPGEVQVWQADVSAADAHAYALLSPDEQARADRFRRAPDRARFVASHAALRHVLARYVGIRPVDLRFGVAELGKPFLLALDGAPDLRFSLAHSGALALVAVAVGQEVGVDVEAERPLPDVLRLARRVAAPHEREALAACDADEQRRAFFRLWVAKEAVLKARGTGLHADARQVLLSSLSEGAVGLRSAGAPGQWTLRTLDTFEGYHAALASGGAIRSVVRQTAPSADTP